MKRRANSGRRRTFLAAGITSWTTDRCSATEQQQPLIVAACSFIGEAEFEFGRSYKWEGTLKTAGKEAHTKDLFSSSSRYFSHAGKDYLFGATSDRLLCCKMEKRGSYHIFSLTTLRNMETQNKRKHSGSDVAPLNKVRVPCRGIGAGSKNRLLAQRQS